MKSTIYIILASFLFLTACGGSSEKLTPLSVNNAPKFDIQTDLIVFEDQMVVTTLRATDDSPITYSIYGDDSNAFEIDATTGVVRFKSAPKYTSKSSYRIKVTASDGTHSVSRDINIKVQANFSIQAANIPLRPSLIKIFDYGPDVDISDIVIAHDDQIAYLVFMNPPNGDYLKILDISNPSSPVELAGYLNGDKYDLMSSITLSKDGKVLYAIGPLSDLLIIDVSNPASPSLISEFSVSTSISDIVLSNDGKTAYLGGGNGLTILDISNPIKPIKVSELGSSSAIYSLSLSSDGNKIYSALPNEGLIEINVSDPNSPMYKARLLSGAWFVYLTPSFSNFSNFAYVEQSPDEWILVNINPNSEPAVIKNFGVGGDIAISKYGGGVLLTSSDDIKSFDTKRPNNPKLIATFPQPDGIKSSDFVRYSSDAWRAWIASKNHLDHQELYLIDFKDKNRIEKSVNFGTLNIDLYIDATSQVDITMDISSDRNDIITIGSYDSTLNYAEYFYKKISIPVSSIDEKTGLTVITITLNYDDNSFSKAFYFNVE